MGEVPREYGDYFAKVKNSSARNGDSNHGLNEIEKVGLQTKSTFSTDDSFYHFPMCLHESDSLPVLHFNELPKTPSYAGIFDKELFLLSSKSQSDFSSLFSPLESPLTVSARTTPESFNLYSGGISPAFQAKNSFLPVLQPRTNLWCNVVLDLQHEVVFKYFSLLLEWAKDAMSICSSTSSCSSLLLFEDMYSAFPLDEDCQYSVWESITEVSLHTSAHRDAYLLMVQGTSADAINDRVVTLDKMIADALKARKSHELIGWHDKHWEALEASDQLKLMQNATRACVLAKGRTASGVPVDVVALQPYQCNALIKALNLLRPTFRVWSVADVSPYHGVPWVKLATQYAVTSNINDMTKISFEVRIWGFEGFIDDAVMEIQKIVGYNGNASMNRATCFPSMPVNVWQNGMTLVALAPTLSMASNNDSRLPVAEHQPILKNFVGSYSFRDREAGIFYYAFEKQFHAYIQTTFNVVIIEEDFEESKNDGEDGNRNAILRISFYGSTQLSITSTRAYLDQLNPHNLFRIQIFYPMVGIVKYKELLTRRSIEIGTLNDIRHSSMQKLGGNLNVHPTVDPMQLFGAINIRIKPPMQSNGLNRMPLPADCTVTICGSILVKEHSEMLTAIEKRFNEIPSEHLVETVTLAFGHPLKKQLTVKSSRDEFIKQHNLIGLKWDEGSRNTGSIGSAKLWASSRTILNATLSAIHEVTKSWMPSEVPQIDDIEHWPPLSKEDDASNSKAVLQWPNAAMRYALLSNPLSGQLSDLLKKWTDEGLACKYPFRDRTNPNAAILLQGVADRVSQGAKEIDDFLQSSAKAMKCILLIVPHQVYASLVAKDLAGVKLIQGQAGVHMVMNSSMEEVRQEAQSMIDLRLSSNRNCLLSVRVENSYAHHSLDVIVVVNASPDVGLSWGAKHELIILEGKSDDSLIFSHRDEELLMNGRVQIHTDTHSCKTSLRVMILTKDQDGKSTDFEANVNRIVKGLEKADSLSLKGLSIVMPRSVCSMGVAAVIKFARKCYSVHSLTRIVCIEQIGISEANPLAFGGGSYVSEAMLKLIEEKQRVSNSNITLLTANTPLTTHMKVASYGQQVSRYSQNPRSTSGSFPTVSLVGSKWSGDQSVLIKGVESSVLKAVEAVKEMMKSGHSNV